MIASAPLLLTCATIADCDDFVALGEDHLGMLRRFSTFRYGIPNAQWLRALVNRIDPIPPRAVLGFLRNVQELAGQSSCCRPGLDSFWLYWNGTPADRLTRETSYRRWSRPS